jgi:type VI secretion system protein ImpF
MRASAGRKMAEAQIAERLQPSLLDRLTDDDPTKTTESRASRVIDVERLRRIVQRDLGWLLNTPNFACAQDLSNHPNVARSVVNYGVPEISGRKVTGTVGQTLERAIKASIETFEPRIVKGSLHVNVSERKTKDETAVIAFDVRGHMWAQPMPLELYLRTELDITSGDVSVSSG